jgi:sigma-B regulation protein RsbU (phosphoserine phosphatase)
MAIAPGQILVIATDGIREASNRYGGRFGKEAFYKVIRQNAAASAPDLLAAVFNAVDLFQYGNRVEDDMTLVIVKVVKENA